MSDYGIPYMGSKAKIAASIALNFPPADNFYDLFGGGFSMTHYMLENKAHRYKHFHYNEIKSDVVDLVKRAISGEFNYDKFKPEWISREDFSAKKDSNAYIRLCWSFGNGQKLYMFGSDIESYKKSMHQAVVFDEFDDLATEVIGFKKWPSSIDGINKRRIYLRQKIEYFRKTKIPQVLHQFLNSKQLEQLERLERLERLQQLQQLERLQQLQQLSCSAHDYREVSIKGNSIVYCDIPYIGTADYGEFNHNEFYEWAASRDFPVYVSEYKLEDPRFKLIYSVDKRSLLSSDKTVGNKVEKLFWNRVSL